MRRDDNSRLPANCPSLSRVVAVSLFGALDGSFKGVRKSEGLWGLFPWKAADPLALSIRLLLRSGAVAWQQGRARNCRRYFGT